MAIPALENVEPVSPELEISRNHLQVDKTAHDVTLGDRSVGLAFREFALLVYFVEHRGVAISRQQLLENVWGQSYSGSPRTVDIHVRRLRAKLGTAFDLVTIRGVGYRLGIPRT